jgi:membrane protein YfhO
VPKLRGWIWPLLTVVLAIVPVAGVFSLSRLFYVRDLSLAFRSRFLFLRHAVFAGVWPLWDPYPANGQAAANDALYQLFHPPSLLIRLLLPEIPAYNVWIAAPLPIAAGGAYLFFRRLVSAAPAAAGAVAFALAGPIVSTLNAPNLSWSIAALPFVFWTLDRLIASPSAARAVALAAAVASQALAGEPVTCMATLALALAYAAVAPERQRELRGLTYAVAGLVSGVLLAAVQYVPLLVASRHSLRQSAAPIDVWAFHPLAFIELVVPYFFGDAFSSHLRELSWMVALNSGRDPFYYSTYVGVPVALAAAVAACSRRSGTTFWTAVIAACTLASLGAYTPLYPALQWIVPPLRTFRYPVKYLSLASFGVGALTAMTCQWLIAGTVPRRALRIVLACAAAIALAAYTVVAWVLIAPGAPIRAAFRMAVWAGVPSSVQGAEFLLFRARPLLTAFFLKLTCAAFLLWLAASPRRERRLALAALVVLGAADLLVPNARVNPTLPAETLSMPGWYRQIPQELHERVYVGGRLEGRVDTTDVDGPTYAAFLDGYTDMEQQYVITNQFILHPSGWRMRESLTADLPMLWPVEQARAAARFRISPRPARLRFLARTGTRYVVVPVPPSSGVAPIARLFGAEQLGLYDFNPAATRAYVVADALVGPDVNWQIDGLFEPRFDPRAGVLVSEQPPPASGRRGTAVPAAASFVEDGLNRVVIRTGLPEDGYLLLLDSYSPDWRVDVDGAPAPLMRANGLFRAVHLARGEHLVVFTYHPSALYAGSLVTAATAAALGIWCGVARRVGMGPREHREMVAAS